MTNAEIACAREMERRASGSLPEKTGKLSALFASLFVGYWVAVVVSCLVLNMRLIG